MPPDNVKNLKYGILNYIECHLKYYVTDKVEREKERQKLFSALKDLFQNVPIEQMTDLERFCENGRFDFLFCKCRIRWGQVFLRDIHAMIVERIEN